MVVVAVDTLVAQSPHLPVKLLYLLLLQSGNAIVTGTSSASSALSLMSSSSTSTAAIPTTCNTCTDTRNHVSAWIW